jgi:AMP phosphorylase
LEARTVLETLEGKGKSALAEKACVMSGLLLSLVKGYSKEEGYNVAKHQLENGKALEKFRQIIKLQGGDENVKSSDLTPAKFSLIVKSRESAKIAHVDNKAIFRVCRALGAPSDPKAGVILHAMKGQVAHQGEPLFTMYSSSKDRFNIALEWSKQMFEFEKVIIEVV